jgi:23S rRNA pseudouridine1911/1915/1917 synthase
MAVCLGGKEAITHYLVNQHYSEFTLLDVKLLTGRTHQIRVHMAHINHPVVGDKLYLARHYKTQAVKNFNRQALHARYLSFLHPCTQELLEFTSPIPEDLQCLLNQLLNNEE